MPNSIVADQELHSSLFDWQTISNAFAFLASILNNQPDQEMIKRLRTVFNEEESPFQRQGGSYQLIAGYLNDSDQKSIAELVQELSVEWTRLFRGISPVYCPQPPYAGVYNSVDGVGVDAIMAITQLYSSHGLGIRQDNHNRMDYLGTLLDFISILAKRAAQETELGNFTVEEAIKTDILDFLQKYILPWVDKFIDNAQEYAQTDLFRGYLILLSESLKELKILIED
ncbi:putative component of anaerobic dehydrogenase [Desulfitobacterium dehalogenans ATCC 51507]|uniref:Putative component of anaerobic dehydrogenase n=1 Tax=Desulfitobacterium dehalogenans (strain ATCC 51507 / DSM 9161 / JW/IU-DC1) TaxID=756499 RepID=I4A8G3_DESDJ|nr:molecular chaperone TorD family protein [Desulfitobacterium dehalogenans]AFM00248.1 putative component of anaerobic dehydrogenase [Desulfitobacterium dehalogenans ATCC 51507]